ncbi:MAG: nicotinate-nicotinamide nucleotide adenylyltransferase [Deltaproteobacteria bacterium]|nr:nicotinate-nicotinamide nucleotide adenylyltransferase [Deltaproteobacteria bacterium]
MRIAVYGGSFNPPHVAHQLAVTWVLATQPVDEVWVMPVPEHAFGKPLADFHHRVAMAELAVRHFGGRAKVSTLEAELPRPTRTVETLRALRARIQGVELSLVIGADILPETVRWKGWEEIRATTGLVVMGRGGFPDVGGLVLPEVSSTQVRALLETGGAVDHLLDRAVVDYVTRHGLYRRAG